MNKIKMLIFFIRKDENKKNERKEKYILVRSYN